MERVDEEYETKMAGFEVDCNDGKGEPIACHHVGEFYAVVKEEYERAATVYSSNCHLLNYGPSCFNLGRFHLAGKGVEQNDEKAASLFETSCKSKHLQGCYLNGLMLYTDGLKDMANRATNAAITKAKNEASATTDNAPPAAAAHKSAPAPATKSKSPRERASDQAKALKLFDWACKEGENDSCYFAASHYLNKDASDRNPKQAVGFLERACHTNHAPSCFNLAVMYKHGDTGIPADAKKFEEYKARTNKLVAQLGNLQGARTG